MAPANPRSQCGTSSKGAGIETGDVPARSACHRWFTCAYEGWKAVQAMSKSEDFRSCCEALKLGQSSNSISGVVQIARRPVQVRTSLTLPARRAARHPALNHAAFPLPAGPGLLQSQPRSCREIATTTNPGRAMGALPGSGVKTLRDPSTRRTRDRRRYSHGMGGGGGSSAATAVGSMGGRTGATIGSVTTAIGGGGGGGGSSVGSVGLTGIGSSGAVRLTPSSE
jgi:hypothetical protein